MVLLLVSAVILLVRLTTAKNALLVMVNELEDSNKPEEESIKMRALQNRTNVSFWSITALVVAYVSVIVAAVIIIQKFGVLPYTSLLLLCTAPVLPLLQITVIITARKDVKFWGSRLVSNMIMPGSMHSRADPPDHAHPPASALSSTVRGSAKPAGPAHRLVDSQVEPPVG
jgi:hypothetical protein